MPAGNGVWYFLDPPLSSSPPPAPPAASRSPSSAASRGTSAAGPRDSRPGGRHPAGGCARAQRLRRAPPREAARAARAAPRKVTPAQLPPAGRNPRAPVRGRRPAAKLPGSLPSSSPPVLPCGSHARSPSVRVPLSPPTF